MTPLLGSRRRAEAFAVRADAAAAGLGPVPGGPGSAADPEIDLLVGLVTALRSGTVEELVTPRAAFSADLRDRLLAEAAAVPSQPAATPARPRPHGRRERRLAAAATVAVLLGGTAGMATAAQGALPGEALYPVKRGIEKAAVSLSGSKVGQGRELLSQAGDRLREVQGLMEGGAAERAQIPSTLEDFQAEAQKGAALMVESYGSTDNPRTMMFLRSFAARNLATVESLDDTAPSDAQPGLRDAALLLRSIVSQADQLCPTCWQPAELQSATIYPTSAGSAQARHEILTVHPNDDHSLLLEEASDPTGGLPEEEVAATDPGVLEPSSAPDPTGGPDVTDGGAPEPAGTVDGGDPTGVEPGPSPTDDGSVPSSPPATDPVETGTDPGAGPSDDPSSQPSGDQGGTEDPSGSPDSTDAVDDPSAQTDTTGGGSEETSSPGPADLDVSVVP